MDESEVIATIIEKESPSGIWDPAGNRSARSTSTPSVRELLTHVVEKGETLSTISRMYYQTSGRWPVIYAANRGVIANPNIVPIGTTLTIPADDGFGDSTPAKAASDSRLPSATTGTLGSARDTYTVVKGDTLWSIAVKKYGDGSKSRDILDANRDRIQRARDLRSGMVLILPSG